MNKNIMNSIISHNKKEEFIEECYCAVTYINESELYDRNMMRVCFAKSLVEAYRKIIPSHTFLFKSYILHLYGRNEEVRKLCDEIMERNSVSYYIFFRQFLFNYIDKYLYGKCEKEVYEYEYYINKLRNTIYLYNKVEEFEDFEIFLSDDCDFTFIVTKSRNVLINDDSRFADNN